MATSSPSAAGYGSAASPATPADTNALPSPVEPFPTLEGESQASSPVTPARPTVDTAAAINSDPTRSRGESSTSSLTGRIRSASKKFEESNPPAGFMLASAQIGSSIPSLTDIRRGSYGVEGWSAEGQFIEKERRASLVRQGSSQNSDDFATRGKTSSSPITARTPKLGNELRHETLQETADEHLPLGVITSGVVDNKPAMQNANVDGTGTVSGSGSMEKRSSNDASLTPTPTTHTTAAKANQEYRTTPFDNGYQFPPKQKWTKSTAIFFKAFWKFFLTPVGFLVVVYGLNVVAWGGMLFLLLCNASPAMCTPTCNDINSPRRVWIEIDSQILNALFCVTGFGTIPWRFRDLYYLMQYRLQKKQMGLRRLAGINHGWFRLEGSQDLPVEVGPADAESNPTSENSLPFPLSKTPTAPLTGHRAPPTALWKLDFVVWTMVWNTFLQAVLSGFMWGMNRYDRPSWSTGLFVALACIVAGCGGIMSFIEGKKVKGIEGVPLTNEDLAILERDRELGVTHYNNIKDAPPKEKKSGGGGGDDEKKGLFKRKPKAADSVDVEANAMREGAGQLAR